MLDKHISLNNYDHIIYKIINIGLEWHFPYKPSLDDYLAWRVAIFVYSVFSYARTTVPMAPPHANSFQKPWQLPWQQLSYYTQHLWPRLHALAPVYLDMATKGYRLAWATCSHSIHDVPTVMNVEGCHDLQSLTLKGMDARSIKKP
jgi:hypothetical protein